MDLRRGIAISIIFCFLMATTSSAATLMVEYKFASLDVVTPVPVGMQWEMTFGGDGHDFGYAVIPAPGGGFAVGGSTQNFGALLYDFWFVLVGEDGTVLSNQTYGTADLDSMSDMCLVSAGGYALVGATGSGSMDAYVVRVDEFGTLMWDSPYDFGGSERACSIIEDSDGFLIMAGYTDLADNAFITKINATTGIVDWTFFYGSTGIQTCTKIKDTGDGFCATGYSTDWSEGSSDMWFFKTDYNGNLLWNKTYGTQYSDIGFDIALGNTGGFVLAGTTSYPVGPDAYYDMWMVLTDDFGNEISNHTFGGLYDEYASAVTPTTGADGYVLAGYTESYGEGGDDMYFIRTDNNGTLVWEMTNGTSSNERAYGVTNLSDNGFIIVGSQDFGPGIGYDLLMNRLWYDTDPPDFMNLPSDLYIDYGEYINYQAQVVEYSGIRNFWLNDTRLSVTFSGLITNTTTLEVGTYAITVNAMDKYYNLVSEVLTIHVEEPATTTIPTTTTVTTEPTTSTITTTEPTTIVSGTIFPIPDIGIVTIGVLGATLAFGIAVAMLLKKKK